MKMLCFAILLAFPLIAFCQNKAKNNVPQNKVKESIHLSVTPGVEDEFNKEIIKTLRLFLNSKDSSLTENRYWKKSDFDRYICPYSHLAGWEKYNEGQPSLMQIETTGNPNVRVVKLAYIKYNDTTKENIVKAIYNIVATMEDGKIILSRYLDYFTRNWKTYQKGSLLYKISPLKELNLSDVERQQKDIDSLCKFLNCSPIPAEFYSCSSMSEYIETWDCSFSPLSNYYIFGGTVMPKNIISGCNDSDYYFHEIAHLYLLTSFPSVNNSLSEGFACYAGGNGKGNYEWNRENLQNFLTEEPNFKIEDHIVNPFEKLYYKKVNETSIPYALCALVCERTLRIYGKQKLFELFKSKETDIFKTLNTVGLTKENINKELRNEINLPVTKVWQ